jgi:TatA/E family protein of Tat protein translocase
MGFGSLGISELLVIFVIVLVFFGPKRMPEVARSLGSAMREFRRSLNQIQREPEEADPTRDLRRETKDIFSRMPEQVRPRPTDAGARPAPASDAAVEVQPEPAEPRPPQPSSPSPSPPTEAEAGPLNPEPDATRPGSESG